MRRKLTTALLALSACLLAASALYPPASADVSRTWVAPTLLNGWVNYGNGTFAAGYRMVGDEVTVRGCVASGTLDQPAWTMPAGLRPTATVVAGNASAGSAQVNIESDGDVVPTATGGITNARVCFSAGYAAGQ